MECIIMGFYWGGGIVEHAMLHNFVGRIFIDDSGKFRGTTKDEWGDAVINGKIKENELFFKKEYAKESKKLKHAAKNPLFFSFIPFTVNNVVVGWKGYWKDEKDKSRMGNASCLIFPDRSGPLMNR